MRVPAVKSLISGLRRLEGRSADVAPIAPSPSEAVSPRLRGREERLVVAAVRLQVEVRTSRVMAGGRKIGRWSV